MMAKHLLLQKHIRSRNRSFSFNKWKLSGQVCVWSVNW